jgi:hypothetical protein
MQAVSPGRKTLEEMARWTPATITAWRFGRLRKAASWNVPLLVSWLAQDLVATFPWKTVEDTSSKNLVTHVPHTYDQCTRVPRAQGRKGRKTF